MGHPEFESIICRLYLPLVPALLLLELELELLRLELELLLPLRLVEPDEVPLLLELLLEPPTRLDPLLLLRELELLLELLFVPLGRLLLLELFPTRLLELPLLPVRPVEVPLLLLLGRLTLLPFEGVRPLLELPLLPLGFTSLLLPLFGAGGLLVLLPWLMLPAFSLGLTVAPPLLLGFGLSPS